MSSPSPDSVVAQKAREQDHAEALKKRDEAFESVVTQLQAMTDAYAKAMKDAGVSHYPEALVVVRDARAALALANACK